MVWERHLIFLGFILRLHDSWRERERESKTARPCCPAPLNLKCVYLCFLQNTNKLRWVLISAKSTLLDSLNSKKKHSQLHKVALSIWKNYICSRELKNIDTNIPRTQWNLTHFTSTFKANSWRFLLPGAASCPSKLLGVSLLGKCHVKSEDFGKVI